MLVWIWLSIGLALATAAVALVLAMKRAERRARRGLYRQLGLSDPIVALLMARNGDVLADLALVRRYGLDGDSHVEPDALQERLQSMLRAVQAPRTAADAPGELPRSE